MLIKNYKRGKFLVRISNLTSLPLHLLIYVGLSLNPNLNMNNYQNHKNMFIRELKLMKIVPPPPERSSASRPKMMIKTLLLDPLNKNLNLHNSLSQLLTFLHPPTTTTKPILIQTPTSSKALISPILDILPKLKIILLTFHNFSHSKICLHLIPYSPHSKTTPTIGTNQENLIRWGTLPSTMKNNIILNPIHKWLLTSSPTSKPSSLTPSSKTNTDWSNSRGSKKEKIGRQIWQKSKWKNSKEKGKYKK